MKKVIAVLALCIISLSAFGSAYEASSGLEQKISTTTQSIIQLVESKKEWFLTFVMNILSFYEEKFTASDNERGLYIIDTLQYWLSNYFASTLSDETGDVVIPQEACGKAWGIRIDEFNECEGIDGTTCGELGGTYNDCASACRHEPEGTLCTMQCVQVCTFGDEIQGVDLTQCESYYDGCNTCMVNDEGEITGCTKKYCAQNDTPRCLQRKQFTKEQLQNCTSYYDGCNTCGVENGELTACTEMACLTSQQPKCLQYKEMEY